MVNMDRVGGPHWMDLWTTARAVLGSEITDM